MIKLRFQLLHSPPKWKVEFYNNITRIPFSFSIGEYSAFTNTTYCRNLSGENFMEFRFDGESNSLFEVNCVSIQRDTIYNEVPNLRNVNQGFYQCNLLKDESKLEDGLSTNILRGKDSLCFLFDGRDASSLNFFQVWNNFYLGVDDRMYLKSISLKELSEKDIFDILGF